LRREAAGDVAARKQLRDELGPRRTEKVTKLPLLVVGGAKKT
jgi:hypothetical protein